MFCTNCGNQMNDGAKFCAKCGSKVGDTNQQYSKPEMQLESQQAVQTTTQTFNQRPVQVTTNTYSQPVQSFTNQPYVHQNNMGKKTKKKFSPIGTFSFFCWFIVLFLLNVFITDIELGNMLLLMESVVFAVLTIYDISKGDKTYSKGLSIATLCICSAVLVLMLVFG